jgi:hypothetical protein
MIYYSYFRTIMTYGLLFWGNFPDSITIFRLQKRIIRIMLCHRPRDSCRQGRPLGGASGPLSRALKLRGCQKPKMWSPTGHTLIRSTVAWWFPYLQTKRVAKEFFLIWFYWLYPLVMCFGVYICIFTLCFMFIAANIVCCRLKQQNAQCTRR